jgi:hypothetical protein
MNNELFYIFNQTFFFLSLLGLVISLWLFVYLKNSSSFFLRASFVSAAALSVCASVIPSLAIVIAVSSVPSFMYHMFKPLAIAPFVVGMAGFVGTLSLLIILQELSMFINPKLTPPKFKVSLIAMLVVVVMGFKLSAGMLDYNVILNSQQILQYASTGLDQNQLKKIYTEVALSHDVKLYDEMLSALALNHHASPELLKVVYMRTANSDLDLVQQNYIFLNLSKNPNTSADVLKKLMVSVSQVDTTTKADAALTSASRNPNFSASTISQLTNYPDCEIRRALISYPNITEQVLSEMITTDPDLGIRHDAKRRLDFLHGISHLDADKKLPNEAQKASAVLIETARSTINPAQLAAIYDDTSTADNADRILESLASNCYITEDVLRHIYDKSLTLKGYSRTAVLLALAVNPKTPVDILQKLANEKDLMILRGLVSNPNLPSDVIIKFAPYPDCKIRKEIVCIPGASGAVLNKLRQDADESVVLEATERLREENAYLNICREMKKLNPSCQKYYGTIVTPDLRSYPNTSQVETPSTTVKI